MKHLDGRAATKVTEKINYREKKRAKQRAPVERVNHASGSAVSVKDKMFQRDLRLDLDNAFSLKWVVVKNETFFLCFAVHVRVELMSWEVGNRFDGDLSRFHHNTKASSQWSALAKTVMNFRSVIFFISQTSHSPTNTFSCNL